MMYEIAVLLMLNVIIIVHEFGHFITAKFFGIQPRTFAIGFGKTLWKHKGKDNVEYKINLLPLGGYVDFDMKAFQYEKPYKKFWVLFNGVFFNFLLALIVCFVFVMMEKMPLDYSGSVNTGAAFNLGTAIVYTWQSVINTMSVILNSLLDLVIKPTPSAFVGPIQLIKDGSAVMKENLVLSLPLFILIDVNIMFFNALPFPALDGGRLVFSVLEIFTGKKLQHEEKFHVAGLVVLMIFMVFVLGKDVFNVFIK